MCQTDVKEYVTLKEMICHKKVQKNRKSYVPGFARRRQRGNNLLLQISKFFAFIYKDGKIIRSPFWCSAGIYVFTTMPILGSHYIVLECVVPIGTKVIEGDFNSMRVEKIRVIGEVKNE